jgi:adenosylcobinamide kinase/adenosylcobinamide-phosphate guanylyltransferase
MLTLIIGGARSGKSTFAESFCGAASRVVYVATATSSDDEMRERIDHHRAARQASWQTVEEPLGIAFAAHQHISQTDFVLVDCLTIWLSNFMYSLRQAPADHVQRKVREEAAGLAEAARRGHLVAVTNEVGCGIVPETALARQFRDLQGFLNQWLALHADSVYLLTAGIPLRIKPAAGGAA